MSEPLKVLTIAGSDSGGAAGLQADLRAFAALGVYGMSVVTAVTAQNSVAVDAVHYLPPALVRAQLDAVLRDYGAAAVKTGFLGRPELIIAVSAGLQAHRCRRVVVDPVLVNHRGAAMFPPIVPQLLRLYLLPLAVLLTPNRHEAAVLLHSPPPAADDLASLAEMARALQRLGARHVLLKGGRSGADRVDLLCSGADVRELRTPFVETANTHGAGDTLSAAAAAFLAAGMGVETAAARAHACAARAVRQAAAWQLGQGHGPVWPLPAPQVDALDDFC